MICSTFDMGLKISIGSTFLYCFVVYLCISLFIFLQDNKKLVRYRDNQVVSTKGERFSWVKQQENEEMKKTYVNLKPARKYRFHWVISYTCRCGWVRGSQLPPYESDLAWTSVNAVNKSWEDAKLYLISASATLLGLDWFFTLTLRRPIYMWIHL